MPLNIFEGLESFGFKNLEDVKIYEEIKPGALKKPDKPPEPALVENLYDKTEECPICNKEFTVRLLKKSKLRLITSDFDLKAHYLPADPSIYDVYICPHCGYAATSLYFGKISEAAGKLIAANITPKFKPKQYKDVYSVDDAIERYKLALLNAVVKKAKSSEKAYLCMKIGWLYRTKEDESREKLFLGTAAKGFESALIEENAPICGFDENIIQYLIAAFNKINGNLQEAMKWLGPVVIARNITPRLKERASLLKEDIQKEVAARAEMEKLKAQMPAEAASAPQGVAPQAAPGTG